MNFPDTSFFRFLYWLINSPGLGGIAVSLLGLGVVSSIGLTLRWIAKGSQIDEPEEYAYPTPVLHDHLSD